MVVANLLGFTLGGLAPKECMHGYCSCKGPKCCVSWVLHAIGLAVVQFAQVKLLYRIFQGIYCDGCSERLQLESCVKKYVT